jgi:hypothetical protein
MIKKQLRSSIKVRLSEHMISAICHQFSTHFLPEDHLWLFGSRMNLLKKGGDIDLYIETMITSHEAVVNQKIAFLCDLKKDIGEQKIDVVIRMISSSYYLPIYDVAKSEGVLLV